MLGSEFTMTRASDITRIKSNWKDHIIEEVINRCIEDNVTDDKYDEYLLEVLKDVKETYKEYTKYLEEGACVIYKGWLGPIFDEIELRYREEGWAARSHVWSEMELEIKLDKLGTMGGNENG